MIAYFIAYVITHMSDYVYWNMSFYDHFDFFFQITNGHNTITWEVGPWRTSS